MEYRLSDIALICGGRFAGRDHLCRAALTDSRTAWAGADPLFFAIAGVNHDGHAHIAELYARGVRAFVIEREIELTAYPEAGFARVDSSVGALQQLAAHHRSLFTGHVVAITGSNGKTVVKEWIAQLAPAGVKLVRSPRSYNSQIGVPLSVLMIAGDEDVAIIEAGISRPGEMVLLERIIRPDIGIVTNIGDAHQENFDSPDQKLAEKLILFRHTPQIIYNSAYPGIGEALHAVFPEARLTDAAREKAAYTFFREHTAQENAAAALALGDVLDWSRAEMEARLPLLQPVAMRLELREGINRSQIIDDSYNSDINSLGIALDYLKSVAAGRPMTLILSDILQSGMPDAELYARVAEMVAKTGIDRVVGIGERIRRHGEGFTCEHEFYPTTEAFLAALDQRKLAGHTILVKGNRSSQFEKLTHALELHTHTTTLEVDLDAMIHNLSHLRSALRPKTRVMAMIKAFGYGNGGYEVAATLQRQGVDYLAVAFADEGAVLRERGITCPIVVLNADQDSFSLMITNGLEPEIYNFTSLAAFREELARHGEQGYPVHIKFDTGMHRLGFEEKDMDRLCDVLGGDRLVRVASAFSHLAVSDEPAQDEFTLGQLALFEKLTARLATALPYPFLRHISNSAAAERLPAAQFDMVRLGIGLYGISAVEDPALRCVSALRTRIVQIKQLDPGQTVGYGRMGKVTSPMRIATVPVGYADGLDRSLSNGGWSMDVAGRRAPIVGRVCMDTCMIDVTGLDAAEGDPVTVFGPAPGNRAEDMARAIGTIPYEVMTGISARVKRIYIKE